MLSNLLLSGTIYIVIGAFAGLMAGILGIGGGIIVVPGLVFVFQLNHLIPDDLAMRVAAGSSLAVIIVTSLASVRVHYKIGEILWPLFNKLWPGMALGVISGVIIADFVPTNWLKIIFGIFILLVALKMLTDLQVTHPGRSPKTWVNGLISSLIGLISGLLGIGGGVLIVPYLTYCGITIRKIGAVSNLCTLVIGVLGTLMFMLTGQSEMTGIAYSTGYIYWPAVLLVAIPSSLIAPLGVKLNYILPVQLLKYSFIIILFLTAIKMLF